MRAVTVLHLYVHDDYKAYILTRIETLGSAGRGERQRLARFVQCQDSYVSLVLSGDRHFSCEQAEAAARYFGLEDAEKEFFMLLHARARSGSESLTAHYTKLIDEKKAAYRHLRSRVKISEELTDEQKALYYGDVLFAKIHMLATVPGAWTIARLSNHLRASPARIEQICTALHEMGLITRKSGAIAATGRYLFLDRNSPFISQHHTNFRLDAIRNLKERNAESTHLSMALSMSEKDFKELRQRIANFIETTATFVKASDEESLIVMNLDFYRA